MSSQYDRSPVGASESAESAALVEAVDLGLSSSLAGALARAATRFGAAGFVALGAGFARLGAAGTGSKFFLFDDLSTRSAMSGGSGF